MAIAMLLAFVTPVANASPRSSTISWSGCTDPTLVAAGAECGTLAVPLNHDDPGGEKISLAVSRVNHKTPTSKGTVLAVPNLLSADGYLQSLRGARVAGGDAFDWVGYASRGVAPSSPAITCVPGYLGFNKQSYVPTSPAAEQTLLDRSKGYADACAANQRELLDHMKTTDIVSDMELLRVALGLDKVSLYAQAYGTYVAQVYSTLYPSRVGRMVLDSTVDPRRIWYNAANFDQNPPLQRNLDVWFDWLAKYDNVYHLGTTKAAVASVYHDQVARAKTQPIAGAIGDAEWTDLFLYVSYSQQTWTLLGSAFANWVHNGDGETIKALYAGFYLIPSADNSYGTLMATICTDTAWPSNWTRWRADSWRSYAQAPDPTWGNTWFNSPCLFWQAKAGKPVKIDGSKVDSALLVSETLSAAVPYEGSLEVRSRYPGARVLAVQNGVNYANSLTGNTCVDNTIASYLVTGELPARRPGRQADIVCDPAPAPVPTSS